MKAGARTVIYKLSLVLIVIITLVLIYFDARITTTFLDRRFELPASVYARPLELYRGKSLSSEDLAFELGLLEYRPGNRLKNPGDMLRNGRHFEFYTRGFQFSDEKEPAQRVSLSIDKGRIASLASDGKALDLLRLDPLQIGGIYPSHGEDRLLVRLSDAPKSLVSALLAIEDKRFYQHMGFSPTGIARALLANVRSGQLVAGGSTITQQLVKNYYLSPERTIRRKVTELMMAVLLELHYEKQEILESYINEIYLGQEGPRSIHGFALAARHYFDKPLDELGIHQQALLVGMIKGPSLYNPVRNPERALERRNVVLRVMAEEGVISAEHAQVARAMPLGLSSRNSIMNTFPAYLDLVRRQLRRDYQESDLTSKGLRIYTSFDPLLQHKAEAALVKVLDEVDAGGDLQGAMVVTHFDTGEVAAVVGGRKVSYAGFNRALDARRPAGSLIKPAVYLAALEQPRQYTLATPLDDSPLTVKGPGGQLWQPRNFDRKNHGQVLLHRALSQSYNVATARLGMQLGLDKVVAMLRRLGLTGEIPQVPSLALGAGAFSPLDMTAMYQTIAAGGFSMPLRSIRDIVAANGTPLRRYPLEYDRKISLEAVHLLQFALRAVILEGTGKLAYGTLDKHMQVAGKTGTTNNGRDSWFAGFSGDLLAVTWLGHDDNAATGLTGSTGALRVWSQFMVKASERSLAYRMPDGIETHFIESSSGKLTGEGCADARLMPFIKGSEPRQRTRCRGSESPASKVVDWFRSLFSNKEGR